MGEEGAEHGDQVVASGLDVVEGWEGSCFEHFEDGCKGTGEFGFVLKGHGGWFVLEWDGYWSYGLGRKRRKVLFGQRREET